LGRRALQVISEVAKFRCLVAITVLKTRDTVNSAGGFVTSSFEVEGIRLREAPGAAKGKSL
jgi:hypothetical protein